MSNPKNKKKYRIIRGHHRIVLKQGKKAPATVAPKLPDTPRTSIDGPVQANPPTPPPTSRPIDFDKVIRKVLR
jgi:hypothetical protein